MSHIPSSAMPHAKHHEAPPAPAPVVKKQEGTPPLPWAALAVGGAVAMGGAVAAALFLRGDSRPARKPTSEKAARRSPAKTRRRKSARAKTASKAAAD